MKKRGSRTADTSAAQRAYHTLYASEPKVFDDPFAIQLTGPAWRFCLKNKWIVRFIERQYDWTMPIIGHHVARSRYVEEQLDKLLEKGFTQYVLLGAGMDSFVFRRPELSGKLAVFEIDHPGTQTRKRDRLKKLGIPEPRNVKYIAVDFEQDSLTEKLSETGFQADEKTLFAWLGVVPYLTEASILTTLKDIAKTVARGSELIFDVLYRSAFTQGKGTMTGRKLFRSTERKGEPMITGYDPDDLKRLLPETGFELTCVVSPDDFTNMWFTGRKDGLKPWKYTYVVRARVK
ncbi:MAG: class I SAM-dependent methyltransferase [Chlorobi bacterium]|nr:class I SAM-dependent methyltransferase [Chlorobiota bacterium]